MGNEQATTGFRVVKVKANSPASNLGIEPMLDFLIYPPFENDKVFPPFNQFISSNENKEITLAFFNIASQSYWRGKITPRKWEGEGLLGLTINQDDYKTAHTKVIRVLKFFVNSPMHKAGFKSDTDYILGTEHLTFNDMDEFTSFIKHNNKKPVELAVYNSTEQKVRTVTLTPDSEWGGAGLLGGDIGFGHVHSLPMRPLPEQNKSPTSEPMLSKSPQKQNGPEFTKIAQDAYKEINADTNKNEQKPVVVEIKREVTEEIKKNVEPIVTVLGVNENDILVGEKKAEEAVKKQEEPKIEKSESPKKQDEIKKTESPKKVAGDIMI